MDELGKHVVDVDGNQICSPMKNDHSMTSQFRMILLHSLQRPKACCLRFAGCLRLPHADDMHSLCYELVGNRLSAWLLPTASLKAVLTVKKIFRNCTE